MPQASIVAFTLIDFGTSFVEFVLATFIPVYFGFVFVAGLGRLAKVEVRYLSAFAFGLLFWFFFDTLNDAVQLGVNEGFAFSFRHLGLVLMFLVGFLFLALSIGLGASRGAGAKDVSSQHILPCVLVALGMGFHGVGEGLEFGGLSAGTQAFTVLDAIGGPSGGVAYVLHKFLEATVVMIVFVGLTNGKWASRKLWVVVVLGLAFGLPSALGEIVGYYVSIDPSNFFALGGGAALVVTLFVIRPIFSNQSRGELNYSEWVKIALALLSGFLCLYAAALFHSVG